MIQENVPVTIHSRNNRELPSTNGSISKIIYDQKERYSNAIKTFGMWIAFTFASVFVPILHFILVPSLFITSFVLSIDKSREDKRNEGGAGECPTCHQTFTIEKSKWSERLVDTCEKCHDDLEIMMTQVS
jgi:hypothetical protein